MSRLNNQNGYLREDISPSARKKKGYSIVILRFNDSLPSSRSSFKCPAKLHFRPVETMKNQFMVYNTSWDLFFLKKKKKKVGKKKAMERFVLQMVYLFR